MATSHWKGKSVVVCGATAGLGRAFAFELARQQVNQMTLVARTQESLQTLRDELLVKFAGIEILCLAADMCDKEQLQHACEQWQPSVQSIDLLIQAVGQSDRGRLLDLNGRRLQDLVGFNVLSSLNALQCFYPLMRRPGSSVALIGSLASLFAPRFLGGYAIAKHGLAALAQQARLELADDGIDVLLACPGPIARSDSGTRYDHLTTGAGLSAAARRPGGGANLPGIDPDQLVRDILQAVARKQPLIIRPRKALWLYWLSALSSKLGDRLLRKNSG